MTISIYFHFLDFLKISKKSTKNLSTFWTFWPSNGFIPKSFDFLATLPWTFSKKFRKNGWLFTFWPTLPFGLINKYWKCTKWYYTQSFFWKKVLFVIWKTRSSGFSYQIYGPWFLVFSKKSFLIVIKKQVCFSLGLFFYEKINILTKLL